MPKKRMKRHAVIQPQDPSYKIIALTQGQNTMVDTPDHPWLDQWNWSALWNKNTHSFYAVRTIHKDGKKKMLYMHREILKCNPDEETDHKSHNTLDNRRQNLRRATKSQNGSNRKIQPSNTSGFIGVTWHKKNGRWIAEIKHKKIKIHLGCFASAEEAARVRDKAAKKIHGEFAVLNFP